MIRALAVALLLAAAAAGGYLANRQWLAGDTPPVAAAAATAEARVNFALPDLEGTSHRIDEWRGKALLVNFWATWCAPCRREIPLLIRTQAAHGASGLQVIGVAVDDAGEVAAYAASAGFNYPILIGQEAAIAAAENSGVDFLGLPFTMVIDVDGRLVKTHIGEIHEPEIDAIVRVLGQLAAGDIDIAAAREVLGRL